jgi:hypothetical protein
MSDCETCMKCSHPYGEWFSPSEIRWCRPQNWWMLRHSEILEMERWPSFPGAQTGGGHGDRSYPGNFPYLELSARLVSVDKVSTDGLKLREQINGGVEIQYLSKRAFNCLNYISGLRRRYDPVDKREITYAEWNVMQGSLRLLETIGLLGY